MSGKENLKLAAYIMWQEIKPRVRLSSEESVNELYKALIKQESETFVKYGLGPAYCEVIRDLSQFYISHKQTMDLIIRILDDDVMIEKCLL